MVAKNGIKIKVKELFFRVGKTGEKKPRLLVG